MQKSIVGILSVFLILAAYLQLPDLYQYDSKRILQLLVLFAIGLILLISISKNIISNRYLASKKLPKLNLFSICVIVLFIAGAISVVMASNFRYALLEFSFLFLLFSLLIILAPSNLRQHYFLGKMIFGTAIVFSGLYIVIFFGNYISSFFNPMIALWPEKYNFALTINGVELIGREVLYFDNVRFFNHIQTWTLPILVGFLTYIQKKNYDLLSRGILFLLICCWWMLILATTGRGSFFGIIVSLITITIIWRKEVYKFVSNSFLSLSVGGLLYYLLFILPVDTIGQTILRIESSRPYRFLGALEVWWQNPFFGLGPMHYAQIGESQFVGHPHNFYLQFLSEWGIFAFLALLAIIIIGMLFVYKNYYKTLGQSNNRIIYITLTWSLCAGLIHAFFSGVIMTPLSQIWLVLIIAWFYGYKKRRKENTSGVIIRFNFVSIFYLVFLISTLWAVYYDIFNLIEMYSEYASNYPGRKFYPRFWVQGLFD